MHFAGRKSMTHEIISGSRVKDGVAQGPRADLGRQALLGEGGLVALAGLGIYPFCSTITGLEWLYQLGPLL